MGVKVKFQFPTGRYHATPWDRHVNEGEIEWPPSPWRLLRAFIATWHRKVSATEYPESVLRGLIDKLAGTLPRYWLPPATRFHTRHYMPIGKVAKGSERTTLIFDGFAHVGTDAHLIVHWPHVQLSQEERQLLERLLELIGYLGRAESWVLASFADDWFGNANCVPLEAGDRNGWDEPLDIGVETVSLAAPIRQEEYADWRERAVIEHGLGKTRLNQGQQRLLATLPTSVFDAMQLETSAVRAAQWSRAPGMVFVRYVRPRDSLSFRPRRAQVGQKSSTKFATVKAVRLILIGKPLPRLEDAVRVGDAIRAAAVDRARRFSDAKEVPWVLSGRDIPPGRTHAHAYYLSEDGDGDGRIDHVLVFARAGLGQAAFNALANLGNVTFLHRPNDDGWDVSLEGFADDPIATGTTLAGVSTVWKSVTPYLKPWHAKRGFGLQEQLARECDLMGLPNILDIRLMDTLKIVDRQVRPIQFHRFRFKKGLPQPDTRGAFVEVTFSRPVEGPLALGFGAHYGLGIFRPVS